MNKKETGYLLGAALLILTLVACGGSDSSSTVDTDTTSASDTDNTQSDTQLGLDPDNFLTDALAQDISTTSCTLSDGTETQCYEIVINGVPSNNEIGPFCPTHIDDDETQGGVWFDGSGELYQLDGEFIVYTKTLYGDDWQLYDETSGEVYVTDTQVAC